MRLALDLRQRQQQMLGGDVFILEPVGFLLGLVEDIVERPARAGLGAGGFGQAIQFSETILREAIRVGPELLQQGIEDAIGFGQQGWRADAAE